MAEEQTQRLSVQIRVNGRLIQELGAEGPALGTMLICAKMVEEAVKKQTRTVADVLDEMVDRYEEAADPEAADPEAEEPDEADTD